MSLSRRGFLAGVGGVAASVWLPIDRVARAFTGDGPAGFPAGVDVFRQRYQNWSKEIVIDDLWTCRPTTADAAAEVVTWAAAAGWRVRPRGAMHGWSPILVTPDTTADSAVVLVDTSALSSISAEPDGVRVGAGARLVDVLTHLEGRGLGLASVPAVGDVTVGGMLAIGAHGAAIPAADEVPAPTASFGSISHAAREITAVVWDPSARRYHPRTFVRGDVELSALACSLGRVFITEVVLDAAPLQHLRCRSYVDIPAAELFAQPGSPGRTLTSYFEATGRAEALWYPFTDAPWLKVWEVSEEKPLESRATSGPYNYPFSDNIPDEVVALSTDLVTGHPESTPAFGQLVYGVTVAGLAATASFDLWGPAKDTQLYIKPTTMRVGELGLAVLTSRAQLQMVVHRIASIWSTMLERDAAAGRYAMNMPLEIRASALDGALGVPPALSATSPDPSAPHLDVVVYANALSLTGTPHVASFLTEYERAVYAALEGVHARVRPEWSKNFAFTEEGPTTDAAMLAAIRDQFRAGRGAGGTWDVAAAVFDRLDPARCFGNGFLDTLFAEGSR